MKKISSDFFVFTFSQKHVNFGVDHGLGQQGDRNQVRGVRPPRRSLHAQEGHLEIKEGRQKPRMIIIGSVFSL